jgi:hypothetical protein
MDLAEAISKLKSEPGKGSWPISAEEFPAFSKFGVRAHTFQDLTPDQIRRKFEEVQEWMHLVGDEPGLNAAYLDTTTLYTVDRLILAREPVIAPPTLLDLATFVNSTVLFDHVFHLENDHIDSLRLNEAMDNQRIVLKLPVSSFAGGLHGDTVHSLGSILRALWYETKLYIDDILSATDHRDVLHRDLVEITAAWQVLLGLPQMDDALLEHRHAQVAGGEWASDGPELLAGLVRAVDESQSFLVTRHVLRETSPENVRQYLYDLVAEANYRGLFNQAVASLLGLPYLPNSTRLPFRRYLFGRAQIVSRELLSLRVIEDQYRQRAATYFTQETLRLPFFLAAIVERISDLGEFFEVLADVRAKASGFRQIRAELDDRLRDGSVTAVEKLRAALGREASHLCKLLPWAPTAGALAAVLASLGSAHSVVALAAIGVLTQASQYRREDIQRLIQRIVAPEFWFLTDLKESASELMNAYPKVCKLWRVPAADSQNMAEGLSRIGSLLY